MIPLACVPDANSTKDTQLDTQNQASVEATKNSGESYKHEIPKSGQEPEIDPSRLLKELSRIRIPDVEKNQKEASGKDIAQIVIIEGVMYSKINGVFGRMGPAVAHIVEKYTENYFKKQKAEGELKEVLSLLREFKKSSQEGHVDQSLAQTINDLIIHKDTLDLEILKIGYAEKEMNDELETFVGVQVFANENKQAFVKELNTIFTLFGELQKKFLDFETLEKDPINGDRLLYHRNVKVIHVLPHQFDRLKDNRYLKRSELEQLIKGVESRDLCCIIA